MLRAHMHPQLALLAWVLANCIAFAVALPFAGSSQVPPETCFTLVTALPLVFVPFFLLSKRAALAFVAVVLLLTVVGACTRHWIPITLIAIVWSLLWLACTYLASRDAYIDFKRDPQKQRFVGSIAWIAIATVPSAIVAFGHANLQSVISLSRIPHLHHVMTSNDAPVAFRTADGLTLYGTLRAVREGAPSVLLVHGRGDCRERLLGWADALERMGWNSLRIDLRANGRSEGAISTYGDREVDDILRAYTLLREHPFTDRERMFAIGESMGGGLVLSASGAMPALRGVVLIAPASDYRELVGNRLGSVGALAEWSMRAWNIRPLTRCVPREDFCKLSALHAAVSGIVIHSDGDRVVPLALSERLVERAPSLRLIRLDDVGHAQMPTEALAQGWPEVRDFLQAQSRQH